MNERTRALCQKAFNEVQESRVGSDGLIRSDGNPYIYYEKFAEILVRECAKIADGGWSDPGHQIKQQFGVD